MTPKSAWLRAKRARERAARATATPAKKTPEEILAENIKVVETLAGRGLMHKGALNYGGTPEERTQFYEAVDRAYGRMPEGYGYSFREEKDRFGHTYQMIQLMHVYKQDEHVTKNGAHVIRAKTHRGMITKPEGKTSQPKDLQSRSALRGYAKAQVFMAAGKIYDPKVNGVSEEYKPL